jgi:hypothetical protein
MKLRILEQRQQPVTDEMNAVCLLVLFGVFSKWITPPRGDWEIFEVKSGTVRN